MDDLYNWKPDAKEVEASHKYLNAKFDSDPAPLETDRSLASEMAGGLKRGLFVATPEMIGGAMKAFSPVDSDIYAKGEDLQDSAKAKAALPEMQKSATPRGIIGDMLVAGAEGIGQMAPVIAGGVINPLLGAGIAGGMYGGSTYQDTKERMLKQEGLDDTFASANSEDPRVKKAKLTGIAAGVVQGGGDAAMSYLGGRFLKGAFPKFGKQTVEGVVRGIATPGASTLKQFGKAWGAEVVGEGLTEALQDEGQAAVERAAGLKDAPAFGEQAAASAKGGIGTALLLGPLAGPGHYKAFRDAQQVQQALTDPATAPALRSKAALVMGNEIAKVDQTAAGNFLDHAFNAIGDVGQTGSAPYALDLDNPALLEPFTAVQTPDSSFGETADPAGQVPPPARQGASVSGTSMLEDSNPQPVGKSAAELFADDFPNFDSEALSQAGPLPAGFEAPPPPAGTLTNALAAGGIATVPQPEPIREARPVAPAAMQRTIAGALPGPVVDAEYSEVYPALPAPASELEKAILHNNQLWQSGQRGLMQNTGTSTAQYHDSLVKQYRRSQPTKETVDVATDILSGLQGSGSGNLDRLGMAVPEMQEEVGRTGGNNTQSGGLTNGNLSRMRQETGKTEEVPPVRGEVAQRIAELQKEKAEALADPRGKGIAGGLVYTPDATRRLGEINTEIQRLETTTATAAPNHVAGVGKMVKPAAVSRANTLDPSRDSFLVAISKLGGIDRNEIDSQMGNGKELARALNTIATKGAGRYHHAVKLGGQPLDKMREALVENHYLPEGATINDLLDRLDGSSRGTVYTSSANATNGEAAYDAEVQRLAEQYQELDPAEIAETIEAIEAEVERIAKPITQEVLDGSLSFFDQFIEENSDEITTTEAQAVPDEDPQDLQAEVEGKDGAAGVTETGENQKGETQSDSQPRKTQVTPQQLTPNEYLKRAKNEVKEFLTSLGLKPERRSPMRQYSKDFKGEKEYIDQYFKDTTNGILTENDYLSPHLTVAQKTKLVAAAEKAGLGVEVKQAQKTGHKIVNGKTESKYEDVPDRFVVVIKDKDQPREIASSTPLDQAAHQAASSPTNDVPEPTQAQKEAGNYKMGHVDFQGLDLSIENPAGSVRKGVDPDGKAWKVELAHHYGYIKGTVGRDKDHLDVFVGSDHGSDKVFVVDQIDPGSGKFDEHKVMLGFDSLAEARAGYLSNYDKSGKTRIGAITESSLEEFKQWLKDGNTRREFAQAAETKTKAPSKEVTPSPSYGSTNKLVSADRAAEIRAKLKAKFANQVNSGIDPEMLAMGTELAIFHIEAGVRKFAAFAKAIAQDLDVPVHRLREYLRGWYNGARDTIEDKGLSIEGMDDSAVVREAHKALFEEKKPAPRERTPERKSKHRLNLEKMMANARTEQGKANWKKRLDALKLKEEQAATGEAKPENDNAKDPFFKKGDRVQMEDGSHGEVVDTTTFTIGKAIIGIVRGGLGVTEKSEEFSHSYRVKKDNGVVISGYFREMNRETETAPEVVPAPRYDNKAVDPQRLLDDIKSSKDSAANKRAAASRAKKATSIKEHNDAAAVYTKKAVDQQAAFDAWALAHPAEAIKYQKTAEIVQVPSATDSTGTEKEPAGKLKMDVKETTHTKKGHKLFIVKMYDRVDRDEYDKLNRDAKRTGNGWDKWSKGFQFLDRESADSFVEKWAGVKPEPVAETAKPKVAYADFMTNVYHTLEENAYLQDVATKIDRSTFEAVYKRAYEKEAHIEMRAFVNKGMDAREAYESAVKNSMPELADKFWDRAREKKPAADNITEQQQQTIDQLGPVGTQVSFKGSQNVYRVISIAKDGRVMVKGSSEYVESSMLDSVPEEKTVASPASNDIMVNEKTQNKEGATDGLRGNVDQAAAVREPGGTGTPEVGRETSGDAGGRASAVQRAGKRPGAADDQGSAREPAVSGTGATAESGRNDSAGDNRKRHDSVLEVVPVNYRITPTDNLGKGGAKQKARDNIAAIKLLKQITREERGATPDEQAQLVKYVGWGASELANGIFANTGYNPATRKNEAAWFKDGWEDQGRELMALLSPEEYAAAKKSTMNAHYTPSSIIEGMYHALDQMGFSGGRVLEPGTGIGHFIGLLPDKFLAATRFSGVELDNTSAAIAKLLYPGHDIRHQGFEKFTMPDGFYDAAIGNPPFLDLDVTSDPNYARHKFKLHDYFFAKAIDKVRPGGLLMFVTSKGTMDKANDKARAYISERADLIGALRMPQSAFAENAGTETVTDVIFLQKRAAGLETAGKSWGELKEIQTPEGPAHINEYFADHPEMVLGENRIESSQFGPKYTVVPVNDGSLADQFFRAVNQHLPKDIYTREKTESPADRTTVDFDLAPENTKEGAFFLDKSGNVLSKENGVGVPITKKGKDLEVVKSFIPLRDAVRQVLYVQIKGGDLQAAQKDLKRAYADFTGKFGPINKEQKISTVRNGVESISTRYPNFTPFRDDPDAYLVASIERFDGESGKSTPGPIFTERTIKPEAIPQINSIHDALHVVMHEDGVIDIAKIAAHMTVNEAQAIDALGAAIYHNPQTAAWETDDEYLSGNVKQKLAVAESAAQADPSYSRNVEALKAVQPADMPPSRISLGLGEPILKPEHIQQFAKEVINLGIKVSHLKATGDWTVEKVSGYQTTEATSDWGTARRDAAELINAALNSNQLRIESYEMRDGKEVKVFDKDATNAANEKLAKIKERFARWVWEHPGRSEELARAFNDAYNTNVKRVYGGDHISKMTFPGMSAVINPHEHQKRGAWRIVQSGNTYMAHSVGAGKTIASILAGMELKRLGIKKKPSYVVPNHMLKQFATEFLQLYPAAKIIVADENQFSKENRNRFMGRVAAENWDAVIITHTAFGKMQVSPEFSSQFINDQIDELEWALSEVDSGDRLKRKQIERAKARLEQRLEKVLSAVGKDKGVTFEETGIDQIFVDEAHEFRKLDFVTNQTNIKGIDPNGSLMAFDLYVKSRYLEKLYPNRSLVLMSGTAITNTIGEIFTIQRFLQESKLQELGIDNFDAWSSTFGDLVTKLEATPAGNYKPVTRFAKFKKLSSLSQLWSEVGDFIHARDLSYIKRPAIKTGGRIIVTAELSPAQKAYKLTLAARIKAIEKRKGPPKKGDDILLKVITDGRHAALDERYISSGRPSKDNKLEKMVSNVAQIWKDTKKDKLTQMIFCDQGVPGSEERRGFSAYNQIKESLIKQGVPAVEIAFMQDYKKSDEKIKLFRAMNEGKVRVLIGSSEAMGTGVNAQKLLVALHHLDPDTYLPSNIEQREGRIVRQGNTNEEVQLYTYVTKGSYDETMWQFLETKQRFIDDFLSGESTVDEATDVDGSADSFAMARAMSSDNPLILERAGIESDIQRLESLRRAYFDDQQRLRSNVSRAESNLPHYRKEMTALDKVIAQRVDTAGDKFAMTVGNAEFDERKKAGEVLITAVDKMLTAGKAQDWHKVGEVAGLDIMARSAFDLKIPFVQLSVGANGTYSNPLGFTGLQSTENLDAVGLAMKMENMARSFDKHLSTIQESAARDEKLLKDSKERVGRPFEHAQALEEKRTRLDEIERILQAEERKSDAGETADSAANFNLSHPLSGPSGLEAHEAQAWVKTLPIAKRVNVVQSVDDLPADARAEIDKARVNPNHVQAMELHGTIHVITDNVPDMRRVKALVIGHELAHAGQTEKIVDHAVDWYKRTKGKEGEQFQAAHAMLERIAYRYGFDLDNEAHYRRAVQEATAAIAEQVADGKLPTAGLMQRLFMHIKYWLRKNGLISHVSDSELSLAVAEMLRIGEKRLSTGKGGDQAQMAVAHDQTDTPAFKRWFGDSKVVDNQGKPLVVYHATIHDFNQFKQRSLRPGFFFSADANHSDKFIGKEGQPNIMPVFLKMERPFDYRVSSVVDKLVEGLPEAEYNSKDKEKLAQRIKDGEWQAIENLGVQEAVQAAGYDGYFVMESFDNEKPSLNYAVYSPSQIKSATGNNGQFDPANADIRFALQDQAIAAHAAAIKAPQKVADMTKGLFELIGQSIPERLKANIGKILSNPWFGSEGKPVRRKVVNLNIERSQNRNGIISDLFQASEGYTGVEGLDNILKNASKEERKQFNELIKYGDRNDIAKTFTRDELYRGKTPFGKLSRNVVEAYKAFVEVMQAANRVRFQQLDELSMLPYKDQEWFDDLVELLNRNQERMAGLSSQEAGEFHRLVRSLKRDLTDEQLAGGDNPAKVKASPAVIAAYRAFWAQVDKTDRNRGQGMMLSAFRDILGYRGELDKLKNEWGSLKGYAPRNRKDGDWHVSVYTVDPEGERIKVYMKPTRTETGAKSHVKEIQADLAKFLKSNFDRDAKYEVEYERNTATPSELLAWKGSEVAVEALLNTAFDRAGITGKMSVEQWQSLKHEVFQQIAHDIMAQGFGRHGISREATLIEGYDDTDYQTVLKEYISGMSGWLSKMRFAIETTSAAKEISAADPSDKVWVNDYVQDAMKNSTYMDELAATARSVGAVYYLGFKVSSAILNAFQNYTVGQAELSMMMKKAGHKGSAVAMLAKAQKDVMNDWLNQKRGGKGTLNAEEADVLQRAVREGTAQAQAVRMISGSQEMGFGTSWKRFTELSMTPFAFVEQRLNREPGILAAYRVFKKTAAGTFDAAAYKQAEEFVNSTHYVMGRENLPEMIRKLGPLGKTVYLFQGYVHNYLHWMFNRAKQGEFATIARSLGAIAALGGVFALPGADDLDKWILKWFGVSYKMKFKKFMRDNAGNGTAGQLLQDFVNHGVTSVAGVDMSRALAVNVPFISDPDKTFGERMGGAWGGLLKKPGMALSAAQKGDYLRALENILPEAAANPMRAVRQYNQGATTLSGKPIFDETGHQIKYGAGDVAKKMLGFNPLEVSELTEMKGNERNLNAHWKDRRDDVLANIRRARTQAELNAARVAAREFNMALRKSQAFPLVSIITADSMRRSRTFKPQKKTMIWERNQLD